MLVVFLLLADLARDPSEWHARGMAHIASGEFGEARVCFNRAIESDPRSPALRINLGNVLVKLGRRAEAGEQYRQVLSQWKKADPALLPYVQQAERGLARVGHAG